MFAAVNQPHIRIEPMKPPYPDVRVTGENGKIAIETTSVHWGVGPTGSPVRGQEEREIRAGNITSGPAKADLIPGIIRSIESKCGKSYQLEGDEEFWLVLLGGSAAAPRSTFIFTPFLDLGRLAHLSHELLAASAFSECYLFCELTERGKALYGWDREQSWQQII